MKTIFEKGSLPLAISAALGILLSAFSGCATAGGINPENINVAADSDRIASNIRLFVEILDNEENWGERGVFQYLELVNDALTLVLQTDDFSALNLIRHLEATGVPALQSKEAKAAALAVSFFYERRLSRYAQAGIPPESGARKLLEVAQATIQKLLLPPAGAGI